MTTAMTSTVAAPLASIFAFNDGFVFEALEGITTEELWQAPTDRNNALLWIAGHVVQTRAVLLQFLGERVDTGWGTLFDRGAAPAKAADADRYPSQEDIVRTMREVASRLHARLSSLDDEYLARPATMQIPGTRTVADELAFFALHDSYHCGQLSYVRKSLGYAGLAG